MKANYLSRIGRILLASSFLVAVEMAASTVIKAQYYPPDYGRDRDYRRERDRDRDRDYRRDRDNDRDRDYRRNDRYGRNGGYGGYNQVAINQGYQDGLYTGSNDAQRGQSYNPQRSHFYRNGHGDYGGYGNNGRYGNYQQAYRQG